MRNTSGAVSVLTAVLITVLLGMAAIVVDVGSLYFARRALQSTDDAAALSAVQDPSNAAAVAAAVFARNGYSGQSLSVKTGVYSPDESLSAEDRFVESGTGINAVRVRASIGRPGYFAALFGLSKLVTLTTQSTATRIPTTSFGAGTRLAELDGGILNGVLGKLWGSSLSLSLVDYQSLVTANVDALTFLNQLATDIHVTGNYDQLAAADVTVGQLIQALVETAVAGGASGDTNTALVALKTLQTQVASSETLRLSDIIDLTLLFARSIGGIQQGDENALQLNIMSLLSASARDAASSGTINLDNESALRSARDAASSGTINLDNESALR